MVSDSEPLSAIAPADVVSSPVAQVPSLPPGVRPEDLPPTRDITPPVQPTPELPATPVQPLPPPDQLLQPPSAPDQGTPPEADVPSTIVVKEFRVVGSTVFKPDELAQVTEPFTNRPITFSELLQARSAVTKLYVDSGYITSGAFIPADQKLVDGVVTIQVLEGTLEAINVSGSGRLNPSYIRSRLRLAAGKPLNVPRLVKGLQLLQLDPLLKNLSAELSAGTQPGQSVLEVAVKTRDSFNTEINLDNGRSPSVGSFRRGLVLREANLLGLGDGISVGYTNTDGSNEIEASYTLPINPRNGTLRFAFRNSDSEVISEPFDDLNIESSSEYYEFTFRQPIIQTPSKEFALGLTFSHQDSQTSLLGEDFPLSPGAEQDGGTHITALRFFQEWTQRGSRDVFAVRSQFSFGLDLLDATINDGDIPDSRFFRWQGQAQYVRLLAPDTLFVARTNIQLADSSLLALEQFGTGGLGSVRGYRQDRLLTDNGIFVSAEVRVPIVRIPQWQSVIQLTPFIDYGRGWNQSAPDPDPADLVSVGIGLRWQVSDWLTARIEYGIPLVDVDNSGDGNTLQEDGILFTINATPF